MTSARTMRTSRAFWTAVFIIIIFVAAPQAQVSPVSYSGAGATPATTTPNTIDLLVGRSTVLNVGSPIARVSLTIPDIADALVTAPQQILIHGKSPGTISLFVWEKSGSIRTFEVVVRRDLGVLMNQIRQLFPGEPIAVTGSGKDVVLSGRVSTAYVVDKAAEVAVAYAEKKENVVNLLKLQEGTASNQVLLKVRFAEISRSALQELGASLFSDGRDQRHARTTTQQFAAPFLDQGNPHLGRTLNFTDYLNLFLFDAKNQLGAVVKALQGKGLFQSLAEPNLVATDGKEASFLAGGEYPYPVVQGGAGTSSVTIQFKEFGVRLAFTPTILDGDVIHLKLRPEVSALDFNNAVVVEGFRVPALTTRRADTEVELRDGQTFAIAGLLNNTAISQMRKVPGIGDIPILGLLFRSRAYQKEATELVVMITPQILRRGSTGASQGLPNMVEPFLGAPDRSIPPPPPYTGSPRYGATQQGPEAFVQPQQTPAPQPVERPAVQRPDAQPAAAGPAAQPGTQSTQPGTTTVQPQGIQTYPQQAVPVSQPLTKAELKRIEEARKREQIHREVEAKRQAEAEKAAAKVAAAEKKRQEAAAKIALIKGEEDKQRLEAAAREQAKRDAAAAKKVAEDKKKADEQQKKLAAEEAKRQKALAEAEKKLKEAQSAYEAVVRTTPARPVP